MKESTKADLLTAAKWTKFLCIVGSIGIALIVIFAIFLFGAGTVASGFQFASGAKAACLSDDENELARGIKGLSSLTQFLGILTIIILVIYALILLFALIGVGFAAMNS